MAMEPISIRKTLLQARIEDSYGVFNDPGSDYVIWAEDVNIEPLKSTTETENVDCGSLGSKPVTLQGVHVGISFKFAVRGAGTAGDIPNCDAVMRAAALARTQSVGEYVDYTLIDQDYEAASMVIHYGGNKHAMAGVRGVIKFMGTSPERAYFEFSGLGLYIPVEYAETLPNIDCAGLTSHPPLFFNHTAEFQYFGLEPVAYSVSTEYGDSAELEDNPNQYEITLDDRAMTASVDIRGITVDQKNWFESCRGGETGVMEITLGTEPGQIVELQYPRCQIAEVSYGTHKQQRSYQHKLQLLPPTANDEQHIRFK